MIWSQGRNSILRGLLLSLLLITVPAFAAHRKKTVPLRRVSQRRLLLNLRQLQSPQPNLRPALLRIQVLRHIQARRRIPARRARQHIRARQRTLAPRRTQERRAVRPIPAQRRTPVRRRTQERRAVRPIPVQRRTPVRQRTQPAREIILRAAVRSLVRMAAHTISTRLARGQAWKQKVVTVPILTTTATSALFIPRAV